MNFGDFKKTVAAYLRREPEVFSFNGIDVLADAINAARLEAELVTDFELRKTSASLASVSLVNGAQLEGLTDDNDSNAAIDIKKIKRVYIESTTGGTIPIAFYKYETMQAKNKRRYDAVISNVAPSVDTLDGNWPVEVTAVQHGNLIRIIPPSDKSFGTATSVKLHFDVVKLRADYEDDDDEDFLMVQGRVWLLLRSITQLNLFLKEDQRAAVSSQVMDFAWTQLLRWNETFISVETDDAKLD